MARSGGKSLCSLFATSVQIQKGDNKQDPSTGQDDKNYLAPNHTPLLASIFFFTFSIKEVE
jgi:hypothetical protein